MERQRDIWVPAVSNAERAHFQPMSAPICVGDLNRAQAQPSARAGNLATVSVGKDRHTPCRVDRPTMGLGSQRACSHDAGAVAVGECYWVLQGARAEHGSFGTDAPQGLPGRGWCRWSVGHPLDRAINAMVERAEHGGAGQDARVGQGGEFG